MEPASTPAPGAEPEALRHIRDEIDQLDQQILDLMARRFELSKARS